MNIPVLLITFNRPEHTRRVLEAVLAAQSRDLYVFQDGARAGVENDVLKCIEVRQLVEDLTRGTETHLHTFYSDQNLGCGPGPAAALDWFFERNEMGIVLEDDAVPHLDFFPYCMRQKTDVWTQCKPLEQQNSEDSESKYSKT